MARRKKISEEKRRLADSGTGAAPWKRWGPYLAERAWGTVREDYSADGDAWSYLPHDHARSRAYRWSEDGIAGFCDDRQILCLALALWNEKDPILKERMFGLSNAEGNHGEDVKEYWFYLDGTPTHSYQRMLYKYPQAAYPYQDLRDENRRRGQDRPEYELFDALRDTFLQDRYFDVEVEYAKADAEDLLCRIRVTNRGPDAAPVHVLPHLWYRNTWSWQAGAERPVIEAAGPGAARTTHPELGPRYWYVRAPGGAPVELLFTENETNAERLFHTPNTTRHVKDAFHDVVVGARPEAAGRHRGSKAAAHLRAEVPPGATFTVEVRFSPRPLASPFADLDATLARRLAEADAFYEEIQPEGLSNDARSVQRQAFAGLLWSKQFYHYAVFRWLKGDPTQPPPPASRWKGRNWRWKELHNADVILVPDKWEYPWYASWDLAFHCVVMAYIDPAEAKQQILRMGQERFQHVSGQFPAYEWNFDDINPPVLGWAAWHVYRIEERETGHADLAFLREVFHSEVLSFSFWVNRKDRGGRDLFGGGFLGMDNIGVFDRDRAAPSGGELEQSDGTSWMARFAVTMLAISTELALHDPVYQSMAVKYFEHFLSIAHAMTNLDGAGIDLWDERDGFYYDVVHLPDGRNLPLRVRSMVGIVPLFAVRTVPLSRYASLGRFLEHAAWFLENRPDLVRNVAPWNVNGDDDTALFAVVHGDRLRSVLRRVLDPAEFLSDHGVRALSRHHLDHPYELDAGGGRQVIRYTRAESDSRLFGGNSNWRGPVWFPVNFLLVRSLREYHDYYGVGFQVECPTGSGRQRTLAEVADEISDRLVSIFLRDPAKGGRRPVWGSNEHFQSDPHWRDLVPFFEYFDGDDGSGVGASHQTGWTALVAALMFDRVGR